MTPTLVYLRIDGARPPLTEAWIMGRTTRRALIAQTARAAGQVPPVLTARTAGGDIRTDGHRHAFFLSDDADGDGRIDHLILHGPEGFTGIVLRGIASLSRLYTATSSWPVTVEAIGPTIAFRSVSRLVATAQIWESVTPYWHPWHRKRNGRFGPEEQLRRELASRGFPEPLAVFSVRQGNADDWRFAPRRLQRIGPQGRGDPPDRTGRFWQLIFPEPVSGPLVLGYGCHYGLGLFAAQQNGRIG